MTHPALQFLRVLDPSPDARFSVETYTDAKEKQKPDPLMHRYADKSISDIEDLIPKLEALNRQGAAIYVAVNEFNGNRSKSNLKRVRGIHADLDGASDAQLQQIRQILPPTIAVRSSHGNNQHWYWLLDDGEELEAAVAEDLNRAITQLGADRAAVDISRLLRLPGFTHMKSYNAEIQNVG